MMENFSLKLHINSILPIFFGVEGIFFAQPISDLITLLMSTILLRATFKELDQQELGQFQD